MEPSKKYWVAVAATLLVTVTLSAVAVPTHEVVIVLATAASVADVQHGPFSAGWNASASTPQQFQPIDDIVKHTKTSATSTYSDYPEYTRIVLTGISTINFCCIPTVSNCVVRMVRGGTISCSVDTFGVDPCAGRQKFCRVIISSVAHHDCRSYNVSEMQSGSPTGTAVGCDATLQTLVEAQTYGSAPSMVLNVRGSPAAIRTASAQANSTTQSMGVEVQVAPSALVSALIRTIEYSADSLPGRSEYACVASVGSGGASTVVAEWFGDRERRLLSAALGAWGGNSTSLLSTVHANVTLASQAESVDGVPLLRRGGSAAATLHVSNVNLTRVHSLLSAASSVKLVVAFIQVTPSATLSVTTVQTESVTASHSIAASTPSPSPTLTSWRSTATDSWTGSFSFASHTAPVSETTTMCPQRGSTLRRCAAVGGCARKPLHCCICSCPARSDCADRSCAWR